MTNAEKIERLNQITRELSQLIAEVLPLLDEWNEQTYSKEFLDILEREQ